MQVAMEILIVDDEKDLGTFVRFALSREAPHFAISI
jgi:DNA-binding response OmpR family regulator